MSEATHAPQVELENLDALWFQVAGTLCNLSCHHCFISCHPGNDTFGFLGLETIRTYLEESRALGVKEYYFTGGEPFLNREMIPILAATLRYGPATVLTNGTVFPERVVNELQRLRDESRYSLELRVSIDGYDRATNDPIRGKGTFEAAMEGVRKIVAAGFLPIITMTQTWADTETTEIIERFSSTLRSVGYTRPRLKILPTIHLGMEESRSRPYSPDERVTHEMLQHFDRHTLLCSHSRIVTDRGVAVCPILLEAPGAHMGDTLQAASRPARLSSRACFTCYLHGTICSNTAAALSGDDR